MAEVIHIALFGRRNVGKSSLINTILGQDFAIVSDIPGTTTDPVKKRFEMPDVGKVTLIDSAGVDDDGSMGELRVSKTKELVKQIDMAYVLYSANDFSKFEKAIIRDLKKYEVPYILIHNQSDIIELDQAKAEELEKHYSTKVVEFSCDSFDLEKSEDSLLKIFQLTKELVTPFVNKTILEDIVHMGEHIWLICPIDTEAPEGRLILPQVMAIRDILDREAYATIMQLEQLKSLLSSGINNYIRPNLVVIDSQVFKEVNQILPKDFPLTSFSILLARSKGPYEKYLQGVKFIPQLKDGDEILILESCSHHSSCDDIGRVKLPNLLKKSTGKILSFKVISSLDLIEDISKYAMVIQCGACMITRKQLHSRLKDAIANDIPISNYGMVLAYLNGILERSCL